MNGILRKVAIVLAVSFMSVSCDDMDSFMFEKAECVADFPVNIRVQEPDTVRLDAIGIQGIKVLDDCILVSAVWYITCRSV